MINQIIIITLTGEQQGIDFESIMFIRARGKLADVYFKNQLGQYDYVAHNGLLKTLEVQLPEYFFATHRQNIINLKFTSGYLRAGRKLKGVFNVMIRADKILKSTMNISFKISAERLEEYRRLARKYNKE